MIDRAFWRGRRVLITGHTGFKGGWLALWLHRLEAQVTGIALPPSSAPNLFELARVGDCIESRFCDIRDARQLTQCVRDARPEVVFHLAAQALVRPSYAAPVDTYSTNVMGTVHLLDALRGESGMRAAVMVTTDKVYRNRESTRGYRETDELGGHDPYSASKAASELVIASYREAFLRDRGVGVASARAGNVIGGGDWSPDRLLPDAVRAWSAGSGLEIRRPQATRPWQHVLEPLSGYLTLAHRLWQSPNLEGAWNFGPAVDEVATVREVIERARACWPGSQAHFDGAHAGPHETGWLALDASRARESLGVQPRWSLDEAIVRTMDWYRRQADGVDAREACLIDLEAYEALS